MDIEYNEQRLRDFEVPLHQLEQKILQMESQINNYDLDYFTKSILAKINNNLKLTLPAIYTEIELVEKRYASAVDDLKTKTKMDEINEPKYDNMEFQINVLKNEIKNLKHYLKIS